MLAFVTILIAVLVITWVVAQRRKPHMDTHNSIVDSLKYYYHGSKTQITTLEPRPSRVINNEKAVFATNSLSTALMFIGDWDDRDISYGTYNDIHYAIEHHHGTFNKLRCSGYVHMVDPELFHSDPRLGLQDREFISHEEVPVIDHMYIDDAFEEMKKLGEIKFVTFEEMLERSLV